MLVLTINAGGSSVRLDVYEYNPSDRSATNRGSKHSTTNDVDLGSLLRSVTSSPSTSPIAAVIHRVVHGGPHFAQATVIDSSTLTTLDSLSSLDPLHNPPSLRWIHLARSTFPSALHLATFDTTFFAHLPPLARTLPLPYDLVTRLSLRRYGFHGMAHHSMWSTLSPLLPHLPRAGRLLTLQLGSGCSITALREGTPVDTSMGFGPLQGLLMTTRTGDIDPAVLTYIQRVDGTSASDLEKLLYNQSGMLGVSRGESKDMGELLQSATEGGRLAVDLFVYGVRKYVGAYAAVLGGLDAIAFGGGIGEKGAEVRRRVCEGMGWLGVELDEEVNKAVTKTGRVSMEGSSKVEVWVVSVDEAKVMLDECATQLADREKNSSA